MNSLGSGKKKLLGGDRVIEDYRIKIEMERFQVNLYRVL